MSYWVTMSGAPSPLAAAPFLDHLDWVQIGTKSLSGPGAITTPAACTEAWRASPSSVFE